VLLEMKYPLGEYKPYLFGVTNIHL